MAEGKRSFVLYCDLIHTVKKMPKEKAGELFMTILSYVNDENPEIKDMVIDLVFEPIKQQLKRDLKKWEGYIEKQRENGQRGGRPKKKDKTQKTQAFSENPSQPKKADSVNVSVSDNVINTEIEKILTIIRETQPIEENGNEKFIAMIVLKMIEVFKGRFPKYPVNVNFDYPACLQIAYKIAELKKWKKFDVVNGKMEDCLKSWAWIVDFVSKDTWLSTRSIPDLNSDKEWARLVQKIYKPKKNTEEQTQTAPKLTRLTQ